MSHIPVEVLHEIFIKLDLQNRIECMLVCRFWYNTLDRFSLIYNLDIKNTRFPKVKGMLERFPHRATQVECLELNGCLEPIFDKRELCNMFPNLRQLFSTESEFEESHVHLSGPFQFLHATCKLEEIREHGPCKLTPHLAMSNMFNNLKSLSLESSIESNLISQLRNMPVLEKLRLSGATIKLMDLEVLHTNLPSIKRLFLGTTHPISSEIPQDVMPASLVTELDVEVSQAENTHVHIQFYKYICSKYSSVNKLTFDDYALLDEDRPNVPQIYYEGIFPLYQKLGYLVDTFTLNNYCEGLDAFRKFDDFGMHLKELYISVTSHTEEPPFIEELVQSQQFKYIQHLDLEDIVPESMPMMNNMEALETLRICSYCFFDDNGYSVRKPINFTQLIDACPQTLTTLRLEDMNLKYDGLTTNITCIKDLSITNVELTPLLANIIETSFPKLSTLTLAGDITSDVTISLLKHNLKEVKITAMYEEAKERDEYTIESKCDGGIQCHILKRIPGLYHIDQFYMHDLLYAYDGRASTPVEQKRRPSFALKFICPSVERLFFSTEKKSEKYI